MKDMAMIIKTSRYVGSTRQSCIHSLKTMCIAHLIVYPWSSRSQVTGTQQETKQMQMTLLLGRQIIKKY